jgi:NAD(P)-dependent dehydrogenase (short-subunit alcohol dehydrogenase family)
MAFTKALGGVSLDDGIRVVGVNPGPVATDRMVKLMKRRAVDNWGDEGRWEELFRSTRAAVRPTPTKWPS